MRSKDFSWRYSLPATLLLLSPFDLLASLGMDMYLPVIPFMADALGAGAGTPAVIDGIPGSAWSRAASLWPSIGSAGPPPCSAWGWDCLYRRFDWPCPGLITRNLPGLSGSSGLWCFGVSRRYLRDRARYLRRPRGKQRYLWTPRLYARDGPSDRSITRHLDRCLAGMACNFWLVRNRNVRCCYGSVATLARDPEAAHGTPTVVAITASIALPEFLAVHARL